MEADAVFTVTALDEVAVQLLASVMVTVYVLEEVKLLVADVVLAPPLQAYEPPAPAPDAVRDAILHAVVVPVIDAVGRLLTVTAADVVPEQPLASVTVTVYVLDALNVFVADEVLAPPLHA
jgi:voltage-gated potassium channel Kch